MVTANDSNPTPVQFKAETRQLLDILIHSLYSDQEVFLRELISNASDALTRMNFEMLTNREVVDPDVELGIWITTQPDDQKITIRDTGIGMNAVELGENLGTIAHSGARAFLSAAREGQNQSGLADIIGQFGVGFYSAFMVAKTIQVTSRSFRPADQAAVWTCDGSDTYTIAAAEKETRGTEIVIELKEEYKDFAQEYRLREIIKKHSDFVPYPVFLGESQEPVNHQMALWRLQPREVTPEQYDEFYKSFTLDFEPALAHTHLAVDAPVQVYALLFAPSSAERTIFSLRKEDGVKLYARKILIQEYNKDLLPEYLRFMQGVVDSEDIPLNVSREMIQSSRAIKQLKKLLTSKALEMLRTLSTDKPDVYEKFWNIFGRHVREGIAMDRENHDALIPLLRYKTMDKAAELSSLDDYITRMKSGQNKIYFILGEDERSITLSPHLDLFRHNQIDVLLLTDPLDSFVAMEVKTYKGYDLVNAAGGDVDLPKPEPATQQEPAIEGDNLTGIVDSFKSILGEKVSEVRATDRLVESPARLVDADNAPNQEMQRVYRMLKQDLETPAQVLEINPSHPIIKGLAAMDSSNPLRQAIAEQVYEDALLVEGLHPDPAAMIKRIQMLMSAALGQGTPPPTAE